MLKFYTILFLGRSIEGVLADARKFLGDQLGELIVITRKGDTLELPEGIEATVVDSEGFHRLYYADFRLRNGVVNLIANGGTTQQVISACRTLLHREEVRVYDLQRDGAQEFVDERWEVAERPRVMRVQFSHWTCGPIDKIVPVVGGCLRVTADFGEPGEGSDEQEVKVPASVGTHHDEDLMIDVVVSEA